MKNNLFLISMFFGLACCTCNRKSVVDTSGKSTHEKVIPELPRFQKELSDSDTLALNTDTLLYYQKSACFGFCPTYTYTIYQNGMIKYDGQQHVELLGTRYSLITDSSWKEISEQIKISNFFGLANLYPLDEKMYIPDLPNIIIIIKDQGKRKSITDNHDAPKSLKEFEIYLESKFKEINFSKN